MMTTKTTTNPCSETVIRPDQKFCYRYQKPMVEQCEVCDNCLKPEDLQWNEEDD